MTNAKGTCKTEGCDTPCRTAGLCHRCYERERNQRHRALHPLPERVPKGCLADGCTRKHYGHGYCAMHWDRVKRHGSPDDQWWLLPENILKRLFRRVEATSPDSCWLWRGPVNGGGYGDIRIGGRTHRTHIIAYTVLVGPVPAGLQLDHTCHNLDLSCSGGLCVHRRCCNPSHLEPVTHQVNAQRGRNGAYLAARTECIHGHPYTPENTIIDKRGYRHCRECKRIESRASSRRKRAEAKS